ncbi:hypothetical protein [Paenibacillus hexagrammi]|uniref:Uncharacterized protein n=1 Tax=Paenibacillus hexagrammi TaxID=2908839 RepID=A0ABY3SEM0_9BACL|nr:hypothetical protein [Paenibacillus sp. YPD9-1]UJF32252.1 hypothetical protein L0M14_21390 [Paenibacillus sp. YPD9-1]
MHSIHFHIRMLANDALAPDYKKETSIPSPAHEAASITSSTLTPQPHTMSTHADNKMK